MRLHSKSMLLGSAAATLLSAGCSGPLSTLRPRGPAAGNLAQIGWTVYILFSVIALITIVLVLVAALKRKGSLMRHEPFEAGGGQRWILIGGFAIPFVVLCSMFVFAMERMSAFPMRDHSEKITPDIRVIGHQWWWEVQYLDGPANTQFYTANEIHIPVGRPVDIQLESRDVIHSFWVPALHGKVDLVPGQINYIRVEADKPGEMQGTCGEYCGEEHARMRLLVVAQAPDAYEAWHNQQIKPAEPPTDQEGMLGQQVFLDSACSLCHTVRGTQALGRVGPDLTHIGTRKYIGANSYFNTTGNLAGWVTHAQSLKPGAAMPNLSEFNGQELRALVHYLRELQ